MNLNKITNFKNIVNMSNEAQNQPLQLPDVSERFFLCDCNREALLLTRFVNDFDKEIFEQNIKADGVFPCIKI